MKIQVANLTLRFYKKDGWTKRKLKKYLIDDLRIIHRTKLDYYSVYDNCGYKVFTKDLLQHEFDNPFNIDISWYIGD